MVRHIGVFEARNDVLSAFDLGRHWGMPRVEHSQLTDPLMPEEDPSALAQLRQGAAERRMEVRLIDQAIAAEGLQKSISEGEMLDT